MITEQQRQIKQLNRYFHTRVKGQFFGSAKIAFLVINDDDDDWIPSQGLRDYDTQYVQRWWVHG